MDVRSCYKMLKNWASQESIIEHSNKTFTDNITYNYNLTMKSSCPMLQGMHHVVNTIIVLLCMV